MEKYLLRLYVTGSTPASEEAIHNLRKLLEDFEYAYELEVIDILENPQLAEDEKVIATPTLIKELPPPVRRLIGDLSDREEVLLGLDLKPKAT